MGLLSAIISLCIGVPLGLIAGYYKGIWETIVMRTADIFMSFPSMILILVLVSVIGPSVWTVTLVIGILGWTDFAKLIYGNVLSVREKEYVESAKAVGTKDIPLLIKYVIPNAFAPILINFTFRTATGSILGKYPVRGTVYHRTFLKTVAVGTAGNPAGAYCIRY